MNTTTFTGLLVATCVSLLCLATTCEKRPPNDPVSPDGGVVVDAGGVDATLPPEDGDTACQRACQRMERLKCPGYEGSPAGASCETVCEAQEASDVGSFCPQYLEQMQGVLLPDGGRSCNETELQTAFEACL